MIVTIEAGAAAAIASGHPWVFREAIRRSAGPTPRTGDVVELAGPRGDVLGLGLYDADSPIAVRVHLPARGAPAGGGRATIDERTVGAAIERAVRRRDGLFEAGVTTALRLCNGEGDRVPGLVVDRYADVAVVRTDGAAMASWLERLVPSLKRVLAPRGIGSIVARNVAVAGAAEPSDRKIRPLWGKPAPDTIDVFENGMTMEVDLAFGQKTGAFLDQRDNRARVRALSKGRARVLNLFSYAGGFSIAAALGGATAVTSVDSAARAHASAQRSFRKNQLDPGGHTFVTADAFVFLEAAHQRGERFDLVVSDPPSFAPNERSKKKALLAYRRLHRSCARVLADHGLLCASSCSSHVSLEEFLATLDDATLERSDTTVRGAFGHAADHPTLAAFPEGRYLKLVVLGP